MALIGLYLYIALATKLIPDWRGWTGGGGDTGIRGAGDGDKGAGDGGKGGGERGKRGRGYGNFGAGVI